MKRYKIAFAALLLCATVTLLAVPFLSMSEARPGPWIGKTILFRSTTESPRISAVATGAFLDNLSAGAMAVIGAYPLLQVDVYYGSTLLRGYTGSAKVGTGETLSGSEKIDNSNFQSGDTGFIKEGAWMISDIGGGDYEAVATDNAINTHIYRQLSASGAAVGQLMKVRVTCSNFTDGSVAAFIPDGSNLGNTLTGTGTSSLYRTLESTSTSSVYVGAKILTAESDLRLSLISAQQVTAPSTSGCLLYNSRAMTTQSLLVNTFVAGSYNQSAYTVILSKPR